MFNLNQNYCSDPELQRALSLIDKLLEQYTALTIVRARALV